MEILQLKYFVTTAKEENMTKASQQLHIAQPALSQSIGRLEAELGVRLFDRIGRRICLNAAGEELLRAVEPMLTTLSRLPEKLQEIDKQQTQTISLNVLAASPIVTGMMIAYREMKPETNFRMNRNADAIDWDFRISAEPAGDEENLSLRETGARKLLREEIFLAVHTDSKFAGRKEIALEEVSNEPFLIFPENMPYHTLHNRIWSETGITPKVCFESDNPQSLKELLAAGMGIAFWPEYSWGKPDESKVKLIHIAKPEASRIVTILRNPKQKNAECTDAFYKYAIKYFAELLQSI